MNNEEFIKLGKGILKSLDTREVITKYGKELSKIKYYIYNNFDDNQIPKSEIVKLFIDEFVKKYIDLFYDKNLIDAFKMDDKLPYYKQLKIVEKLPYNACPWYQDCLQSIIWTPSGDYLNTYSILEYVIGKYAPSMLKDINIQNVFNFTKQLENKNLIKGSRSEYYSLEREKEMYNLLCHNIIPVELKIDMDLGKTNDELLNKRIGNIGELCAFNCIKNSCKIHVAKNINDNFGYDIYISDGKIEYLIEVKTTMQVGNDCFSLSENEYNLMMKCISNDSVNYIVLRVYLDYNLNPTYSLLSLKDNTTFIDLNNKEIEYKFVGNGVFVRQDKTKQKTLYK